MGRTRSKMDKLTHINNITSIASRMERQLIEFEKNNPTKTDIITERKKIILDLVEAGMFLSEISLKNVAIERENLKYKVENLKLNLRVEKLKIEVTSAEEKYAGLVKFDR